MSMKAVRMLLFLSVLALLPFFPLSAPAEDGNEEIVEDVMLDEEGDPEEDAEMLAGAAENWLLRCSERSFPTLDYYKKL